MAEGEEEVEVMWKRGRTLGKGGFGFVSLASTDDTNFTATVHHCLIPSLIAVKSCMLSRSESLQVEREFLRLFEDSPHVIRSFGVKVTLEDGVLLYNLLLEYASGGSLADRLNCSGKGMPEVEVKKHTKSVVLGLSRIHGAGIIHCDIKPHNVLLVTPTDDDTTEIAKIADFGLAMTLEQSWTQKQGLRGTKRYMAPESVLKQEYGPEADIWALGCTVYELITGTPLWESSNSDAKVDDVLHRIGYEEPSFENAKLSAEAKRFCEKLSGQESELALDCRHAPESFFSEISQQCAACNKDKEEAKWLHVPFAQTTSKDSIQDTATHSRFGYRTLMHNQNAPAESEESRERNIS